MTNQAIVATLLALAAYASRKANEDRAAKASTVKQTAKQKPEPRS